MVNELYGAIGGDIIGSRFEWHSTKQKDFVLFSEDSEPTDDSILTLATAEAILQGKGEYADAYYRWGNAYPRAGYGGRFSHWLCGRKPGEPYWSWGNGSAMRISPVAFAFETEEKVLTAAKASAECTHNHPKGIAGAQAAALAGFLARTGHSKEEIKQAIAKRFGYELERSLAEIRPGYRFDVSCQGTVPVAIRSFLESRDYEDAIRNAVSMGGDADTLAAITGGIALAFYKTMPEEIIIGIEERLDSRMLQVCREFHQYCQNAVN